LSLLVLPFRTKVCLSALVSNAFCVKVSVKFTLEQTAPWPLYPR
jgi:hypothetical protein